MICSSSFPINTNSSMKSMIKRGESEAKEKKNRPHPMFHPCVPFVSSNSSDIRLNNLFASKPDAPAYASNSMPEVECGERDAW